jgi:hypothetical protein
MSRTFLGSKRVAGKDRGSLNSVAGVGGLGVRVHQLRIVQVAGRNGGGGQSRSGEKSPEMSAARQQSARRPGCPVAEADESETHQGLKQPMLGHRKRAFGARNNVID